MLVFTRCARFFPLLAFAAGTALLSVRAEENTTTAPATFRDQDRWCVVGDSITHGGSYHEWVELYWLTRFPDRTLDVFNCGISGDTAEGGLRRYSWDIAPHRPTVASIMFGMNDVMRTLYSDVTVTPDVLEKRHERLTHYEASQRALVAALQQKGARVILVTPSIFDQTAEIEAPKQTGVNDALGICAEIVRKIANDTGSALIDFYGPMDRLNRARQVSDPSSTLIGQDRIHPGPPGHFVMAYLFLKAQQAPSLVAKLSIDAATPNPRATTVVNGRIERLREQKGGVAFTWTEHALPYPIDATVTAALTWVPFIADLDQEVLQVTGLPAGNYRLFIDGNEQRSYTAEEWTRGINLAELTTTPQMKQAEEVLRLLNLRTKLVAENLRSLAHVEHQSAPASLLPATLKQMRPFLEKRLEKFKTNPPAPSTRESVERYAERKPHEGEVRAEAEQLAQSAHRAAVPKAHEYLLLPFLSPIPGQ